jgi:hypothetical protein
MALIQRHAVSIHRYALQMSRSLRILHFNRGYGSFEDLDLLAEH